jgi:hypothetical protein
MASPCARATSHYPLGTVQIRNNRDQDIHNISLSFYVDGYMSDPRTFVSSESLGPDESKTVPVHALSNSNLLELLERPKISGRIVSSHTYRGQSYHPLHYYVRDPVRDRLPAVPAADATVTVVAPSQTFWPVSHGWKTGTP